MGPLVVLFPLVADTLETPFEGLYTLQKLPRQGGFGILSEEPLE